MSNCAKPSFVPSAAPDRMGSSRPLDLLQHVHIWRVPSSAKSGPKQPLAMMLKCCARTLNADIAIPTEIKK